MAKLFFYVSILALMAVFFITIRKKQFRVRHMFLMITYSLYNLVFELIFGEIFELYYYINKAHSLIYIIIAAIFLYPVIAVLYILYLPAGSKVLLFTSGCIILTLIFEIMSLCAGTIVLTGWKVIPWSVVTYIVSFGLIYMFNRYMLRLSEL